MKELKLTNESNDPDDMMFQVSVALRVLAALVDRQGGTVTLPKEELTDMEGYFYVECKNDGITVTTVNKTPHGGKLQ